MTHLTIGQKVSVGFGLILLLGATLGGVALYEMRAVLHESDQLSHQFVPEARDAALLNRAMFEVRLAMRAYSESADPVQLAEARRQLTEVHAQLDHLRTLAREHPNLTKLNADLPHLDTSLRAYEAAIAENESLHRDLHASRTALDAAARTFTTALAALIEQQDTRLAREIADQLSTDRLAQRHRKLQLAQNLLVEAEAARVAAMKAQALRAPEIFQESFARFEAADRHFDALRELLSIAADRDELEQARTAAHSYRDAMHRVHDDLLTLAANAERRRQAGEQINNATLAAAEAGMERTVATASLAHRQLTTASLTVIIGLIAMILTGLTLGALIVRSTTHSINRVADALVAGADEAVRASTQVAQASTDLSTGASRQAASIEETSAAIEELTGMTKRTAEHSLKAKQLISDACSVADRGSTSMERMHRAMADTRNSNGEISKIIKTIDEIAFQTNLLALNASIEAARAGEAGMGFAVVAEEVRALSQRSATAARETSEKINQALGTSQDGAAVSDEVGRTMSGIIDYVRQIDQILAEIAQASSEQAAGIGQINLAVTEVDRVTQTAAAAAEESAAAAEELNQQSVELRGLVRKLDALTHGLHYRRAGAAPVDRLHAAAPHAAHPAPADCFAA